MEETIGGTEAEVVGDFGSVTKGVRPLLAKKPEHVRADVLTYYGSLSHVPDDGSRPTNVLTRYDCHLGTREQVYIRLHQTVEGALTKRVDLGWFTDQPVGMVCIVNEEVKFTAVPDEETRLEVANRVLAVRMNDAVCGEFLVRPGMSMACLPDDPSALRLRSYNGAPVKFSVYVFPA